MTNATGGKLLSIETGFTCNSRCRYCTQLDYRVIPQADKLDLTTAEIKERIAFAAGDGYTQVGFSGGEPTIRRDFVELIRFARSFECFRRISVTSNGRMFAYRKFTEDAMRAGLDAFTFSLHGPTPAIHDSITAAKGSLDQALDGLRNIARVRDRLGIEAHVMNDQILLPENTPHIKDMVALLGPLGVRLFMIQPFIAQRSNVDDLGRFFVPYAQIVAAVDEAIPELARFGARIKPYNVPNCVLWRFGPRFVEPQFYGLRAFREFERERPGEFRGYSARQWYRIPQCTGCHEVCPGFRIEQLPQDRMAAGLLDAASTFAAKAGRSEASAAQTAAAAMPDATNKGQATSATTGAPPTTPTIPTTATTAATPTTPTTPTTAPLIFGGTELLDRPTLAGTVRALAAAHGPVAWMTALCERVDRQEIAALVPDLAETGALTELA